MVAMVAVAPATARADHWYSERFLGWSKDHTFYAMVEAGTDERELPALCVSRRGDKPSAWPKDVPLPDADDDRGCTDLDQQDPSADAQALVAKASGYVIAAKAADKGPHGETVAMHAVGDASMVEVAVARGGKTIGRAYFKLKYKGKPVPTVATAHWRDDGLSVAVDADYPPPDPNQPQPPGYGPPTFLVVIPLDGSTANAARPKTPREESYGLNLEGMKLLKASKLDDAQKQFVAATEADNTYGRSRSTTSRASRRCARTPRSRSPRSTR